MNIEPHPLDFSALKNFPRTDLSPISKWAHPSKPSSELANNGLYQKKKRLERRGAWGYINYYGIRFCGKRLYYQHILLRGNYHS